MGKRYYCDYCDKIFPDNPTNRRNHLNGVQHRTMRKIYYDAFQDPEIVLAENARKNPCRQFLQTDEILQKGECKYGAACKFSHLTPADKERLMAAVAAQQAAKVQKLESENKNISDAESKTASLDDAKSEDSSVTAVQDVTPEFAYKLPQALEGLSNLPPSVLPPPADSFTGELPEWG